MEADPSNFTRTGISPTTAISADELYTDLCDAETFDGGIERLRTDVEKALGL